MNPPAGCDERRWWADRIWLPWIDSFRPLAGARVVEYGCGPGSVSRAVAPRVARHVGIDIDADAIVLARELAAAEGQANSEFVCRPPAGALESLAELAGEVDVVLLYAVLEHLTIDERLELLRTAREVAAPDGIVVVVELPNRLVDFDQHSSWLPYAMQLPDELALPYMTRSPRPEVESMVLADDDPMMALKRFGRGASFHEFELGWGEPLSDFVVASSWDLRTLPHREVSAGEIALARSLAEHRPDLDAGWSRQWIDAILSTRPLVRKAPAFRPWTGVAGPASMRVSYASREVAQLGADSVLHVELPEPTRRLALRVVDGEAETTVTVELLDGTVVTASAAGVPGERRTVSFELDVPADDVLVRMPRGGWIAAVLFEGHGR